MAAKFEVELEAIVMRQRVIGIGRASSERVAAMRAIESLLDSISRVGSKLRAELPLNITLTRTKPKEVQA